MADFSLMSLTDLRYCLHNEDERDQSSKTFLSEPSDVSHQSTQVKRHHDVE